MPQSVEGPVGWNSPTGSSPCGAHAPGSTATTAVNLLPRPPPDGATPQNGALTLPDGLGAALQVPAERLASEIAFSAAVRLYEEGRVSLAKAAEIAGIERFSFAARLAEVGIPTAAFDPADVGAALAAAG